MADLKLYTVAQVRDWLERNIAADRLTNEVIRPALAWAIIHNPFVQDEDPIVAAIYDDGVLAASTCAFPEILAKPQHSRVWWFPMLWVKPEFRGKAYGLVAIGSLAEIYGVENSWTAWAVPESIEIFEYLGCKTYYFPRYFMEQRHINSASIKGKLAALKQKFETAIKNWMKPSIPHYDFTLRYPTNVDDESYDFICRHNEWHFLQSSKAMLNWNVQYPWTISSLLPKRVHKDGEYFADIASFVQHSFVQVRVDDILVGVYRLCRVNDSISCDSIFYESQFADIVYSSVVEHLLKLGAAEFDTEDKALAEYIKKYIYFPKYRDEQISISVSPDVVVPDHLVR